MTGPAGFTDVLGRRLLVCDGAMGTMLPAAGGALDRALPEVSLSEPKLVAAIHESYISAGADVIQTNTFGANRLWLAGHGYPDQVEEINRAAAGIAREMAERSGREVFVAGSVSPAVTARPRRPGGAAEREDVLAEPVRSLVAAGVDLLILETFGYLDELAEAVAVASGICDIPIVAQATFADDERTLGGETPHEVASVLGDLPIVMLGTNCTIGPQRMLAVVESLVQYATMPVSAQPNAGQPRKARRPTAASSSASTPPTSPATCVVSRRPARPWSAGAAAPPPRTSRRRRRTSPICRCRARAPPHGRDRPGLPAAGRARARRAGPRASSPPGSPPGASWSRPRSPPPTGAPSPPRPGPPSVGPAPTRSRVPRRRTPAPPPAWRPPSRRTAGWRPSSR